jgi:hypothetical protein
MIAAEPLMPSFADNAVRRDENAPDHRIRLDISLAPRRQFERSAHVPKIEFVLRHAHSMPGVQITGFDD